MDDGREIERPSAFYGFAAGGGEVSFRGRSLDPCAGCRPWLHFWLTRRSVRFPGCPAWALIQSRRTSWIFEQRDEQFPEIPVFNWFFSCCFPAVTDPILNPALFHCVADL